jgi:hypothetical protein
VLIQPPVCLFPEPHHIEIQFETFNYILYFQYLFYFIEIQFETFNYISYFQYLFYLFLLFLRLLAERVPSWPGVALHKIMATIGGCVSVAKAQHPWKAIVGP